jgi:SAM-dependent methyltransferase
MGTVYLLSSMNGSRDDKDIRATRGNGLLEGILAKHRCKRAERLIPSSLRDGRILDIGCGTHPSFLCQTRFGEKYSIDQHALSSDILDRHGILHKVHNLNDDPRLPFEDNFFNAVTFLAVVEHLSPEVAGKVFCEIHRILRPGGITVVTTPASWSDRLLRTMSRLGLVSPEEIDEHAFAYTLPLLGACFGKAGFGLQKLRFGYFEAWLNLWALAEKE